MCRISDQRGRFRKTDQVRRIGDACCAALDLHALGLQGFDGARQVFGRHAQKRRQASLFDRKVKGIRCSGGGFPLGGDYPHPGAFRTHHREPSATDQVQARCRDHRRSRTHRDRFGRDWCLMMPGPCPLSGSARLILDVVVWRDSCRNWLSVRLRRDLAIPPTRRCSDHQKVRQARGRGQGSGSMIVDTRHRRRERNQSAGLLRVHRRDCPMRV